MNMDGFKASQMKAIDTMSSIKKTQSSTSSSSSSTSNAFRYQPKTSSSSTASNYSAKSSIYTSHSLKPQKEKQSTRVIFDILSYLKTLEGMPADTKEIMNNTNHSIEDRPDILELLRNNPKVIDHGDDKFSYKPLFNVKNIKEILELVNKHPGGILASDIAESYNQAEADVKKLKETKQVYAIKSSDNTHIDMLFPNDEKYRVPVSQELIDMWKSIKVPTEADLEKEMKDAGLSVVESAETIKVISREKKKERKKRITKVTNTHIENFNPNDDVPQLGSKPLN
ncbi:hypothetical protein DICPUDRAFT_31794 [Dictyostelium purpureum]|uniref:Transcription initiation factor IIE subunit beta n=1 Tax=Dictyostelium purpureum TaxID=5786 RepID=F0ZHX5_DICPU|nr:uncharacterized protein DICPUDRAFT_31794 [Dictyostelium purpureum]EGC36460.1 hypothetical protein DICPUDRAFT_31794 [Dictyostelium purpureum]|eukprot:XP_003287032.1 hypothetical protein DICPUDRAFT_31794 [Dictyostelium purpureum]